MLDEGVADGCASPIPQFPLSLFHRVYRSNRKWVYRDAMDKLGCKRYCCRRMIMTHVDLIEKLLK